jgi:hypothetical protein
MVERATLRLGVGEESFAPTVWAGFRARGLMYGSLMHRTQHGSKQALLPRGHEAAQVLSTLRRYPIGGSRVFTRRT